MLSDPVDHGSWHFVAGSCASSCERLFCCEMLQILDFLKFVLSWDPGDLESLILFHRWDPGDPGSWFIVISEGSWRSWIPNFCFVVRSWRSLILSDFGLGSYGSWILTFCFVVGSCDSWIPIFGCGTRLVVSLSVSCGDVTGDVPGRFQSRRVKYLGMVTPLNRTSPVCLRVDAWGYVLARVIE